MVLLKIIDIIFIFLKVNNHNIANSLGWEIPNQPQQKTTFPINSSTINSTIKWDWERFGYTRIKCILWSNIWYYNVVFTLHGYCGNNNSPNNLYQICLLKIWKAAQWRISRIKQPPKKVWNMFKVNNKDSRTTSMISCWCLYYNWTYFTTFSNISVVNFEKGNVCWVQWQCFEINTSPV